MSDDLDRLQGTWTIAAMEMDGGALPPENLTQARVVIEGSRFTSLGMGETYQGTLVLDPAKKPARFDLKFDAGPEKGNTNPGIYQLDGDSWKLCLATRGTVRPKSFRSAAGSGIAVQTLVRGKAAKARPARSKKAAPPPASPATEFEGEWQMVSAVMNGQPMEASLIPWVKRITQGNQTTVLAGPQTMLKVEFTHDAAAHTIEYLNLAGAQKGKRQAGMYQLEGGILTVCVAPPGDSRPAELSSVKGDGRTLTVWKRTGS